MTRVTCQAAAEGAASQGGPHVRGADADRGRVHRLQPAQAAAQHARDHRHSTSQQVDRQYCFKIVDQNPLSHVLVRVQVQQHGAGRVPRVEHHPRVGDSPCHVSHV